MLNRKQARLFRVSMKRNSQILRKLLLAFAIVLIATGIYLQVQPYTHDAKMKAELETKSHQLIETKNKLQQEQTQNEQQFKEQQQKLQEVQQKLDETEKALQAKRASQRAYAASLGAHESCLLWMSQAGIPSTYATNKLIVNESGCRPWAVNSSSGACGIPQAWPCSKLPCKVDTTGAVCQLKWMDQYVKNRYGTWDKALSAWYSRCNSRQGCWY